MKSFDKKRFHRLKFLTNKKRKTKLNKSEFIIGKNVHRGNFLYQNARKKQKIK